MDSVLDMIVNSVIFKKIERLEGIVAVNDKVCGVVNCFYLFGVESCYKIVAVFCALTVDAALVFVKENNITVTEEDMSNEAKALAAAQMKREDNAE